MYTSIVRTLVPLLAGVVITRALRLGVHLDQEVVTDVVQVGVSGLYYATFRWAETRLGHRWGWALGLARPPQYDPAVPAREERAVLDALRRLHRSGGGAA